MICAACHGTSFSVIPGVTRWATVYACKDCGILRVRLKKDGIDAISKILEEPEEGAGDS